MSRHDSANRPQHRIAFLLTHPIQYISPFLSYLSQHHGVEVVAFYQSDCSLHPTRDKGFGIPVAWDRPLLDGYESRFLPALGSRHRVSYLRPLNYGLGRELGRERFDALVVHGYNRPFHWHAIHAAHRRGVKVFIRDDATLIARDRTPINIALKQGFFGILDRYVSGYLSAGKANREYYLRHGIAPPKIFDMPWAVDNTFFQSRAVSSRSHQSALRAQLGIEPGAAIILYVGKLLRTKGVLDLLDAFERASAASTPKPYLIIVGDGALRDEVAARAVGNARIIACGFKNQTALPEYYALCDVFVLPSHGEQWGLVVNEAMNAGKAVIVSDRVGCRLDLVLHQVNGYVFPANRVGDLASCLQEALSDPQRLIEMGRRSLAVIQNYSFQVGADGLDMAMAATVL